MNILGISAFYHDSASCLVVDGEIVSAAQEERFTRKKHDHSFPKNAVNYCMNDNGILINDVDIIAFYEKPFIKFERILETYLQYAPFGVLSFMKSMPIWIKQKLWMKDYIKTILNFERKIVFCEHHEAHAASAFFPSPYKEAAFLTVDGVGEWTTTSYGVGKENKIEIYEELKFPHSLGLLYSAFTYYTGFKVNSAEYKVMGLAPYGEPKYKDLILSELINLKEDGSFVMNMDYFDYCIGLKMTNSRFDKLFGSRPRKSESLLTQKDMDIACSIQAVTEEIMLKMAKYVGNKTNKKNICLAGGVALNCVANGKILKEKIFENIWIQPAAGDAGGAIGAALLAWHQYLDKPRIANNKNDSMKGAYLGPEYNNDKICEYLKKHNIKYTELKTDEIPEKIADLIAKENVIGWFQGRMEFGPRSLGSRSIIGDARSQKMQEKMNLKIKYRESFRPFAPSILLEKVSNYFDIDKESPYMLLVANVKKELQREMSIEEKKLFGIAKLNVVRSAIPAVTHIDYSARIQTVSRENNQLYYDMIKKFDEKYGCPVIINTSFNVRGEPIVCTPQEAYVCFMRTEMDYLIMGNFLLDKRQQKPLGKDIDWRKEFELD
ncbi:MAG: hypothetical protein A2539_02350 [Elusimicrobia bacterium RIFOXYD2_FULL_34_15]|nr:MAG: hypothetical protein A2539_02350 [Elusimicrobia bacterium RIFOXYD2_FULL_34_15]